MNKAQPGYPRLFINLGKRDGFYPGELMQTLNRYVGGRQEVGHIDLLDTISYFEVPEKDARKVMTQLSGIRYHGRTVRCNSEEDAAPEKNERSNNQREKRREGRRENRRDNQRDNQRDSRRKGRQEQTEHGDWRQFFQTDNQKGRKGHGKSELKGEEPDFTEEGWARRKPRKK